MFERKILNSVPYLSSVLHQSYTKSYELVEGLKTIPQKWIQDLKDVEYNELLSSSIGPLALFFWLEKKTQRRIRRASFRSFFFKFSTRRSRWIDYCNCCFSVPLRKC